MRFAVTVSETLSRTVIIDDERVQNINQACEVVQNAVNKCDIVLDADDFAERNVLPSEYYHLGRVPDDADTSFYSKLEVTDELLDTNLAGKARYRYDEVKDSFQKINVKGHICDFCNYRMDRNSIPDDRYMYEVAGDDDCGDIPCRVRKYIAVNFFGTLISDEELPLEVNGASVSNGVMWLDGYNDFVSVDNASPAIVFKDEKFSEKVRGHNMIVTGTMRLDDEQFNEIREFIRNEEIEKIKDPNELYIDEVVKIITSQDISQVRNIVAKILKAEKDKIEAAKEDGDFDFHFSEAKEYHQMEICLDILKM